MYGELTERVVFLIVIKQVQFCFPLNRALWSTTPHSVVQGGFGLTPLAVTTPSSYQVHKTSAVTATCETEPHHDVLAVGYGGERMRPLVWYSIASRRALFSLVFPCPTPPASCAHTPWHYWYCDSAKSLVM